MYQFLYMSVCMAIRECIRGFIWVYIRLTWVYMWLYVSVCMVRTYDVYKAVDECVYDMLCDIYHMYM